MQTIHCTGVSTERTRIEIETVFFSAVNFICKQDIHVLF